MNTFEILQEIKEASFAMPQRNAAIDAAVTEYLAMAQDPAWVGKPLAKEVIAKFGFDTSTLPYLAGGVLDRRMLAFYETGPVGLTRVCKERPNGLRDMREVYSLHYAKAQVLAEVGEGASATALDALTERKFGYTPKKYGKYFTASFESFINDDVGFFAEMPKYLATLALNTEAYVIAQLVADTSGWKSAAAAAPISNLPLTFENLVTAYGAMIGGSITYCDNQWPIVPKPKYLIVTPALQLTAMRLLGSNFLNTAGTAGTVTERGDRNVLVDLGLELVVCPELVAVAYTAGNTYWQTMWGLVADNIPWAEYGRLAAMPRPIIGQVEPAFRTFGATLPAMISSLATLESQFYVWHVFGAGLCDSRAAFLSNGQ